MRELIVAGALALPLSVGFFCSFGVGVLVVLTTRWHGNLSLDEYTGIQKMHSHPTPRIGGMPIVLALLVSTWISSAELQHKLWPVIVAGMPAFFFGVAEDLTKRISIIIRLFATMTCGVLGYSLTGYSLTSIDVWGVDWLLQFTTVSVLFTAFAVGGIANAINIIDGLNGLASSVVLWALLGLAYLANYLGDVSLASACLLLSAIIVGFLVVNWPFGKLFLGDGGSYFLGFSLAWACVLLTERNNIVSPFAALLICIHPVTEVIFSVYRRKMRQKSPSQPDRLHLHSLINRRVMQRILPKSSKVMRNSAAGALVSCMTMLPAIIVQSVYDSTVASLLAVLFFVLGYLYLFRRIVLNYVS